MIRVMVVDDSPLVRRIAADILTSDLDIEVAATAATAEFALQKLAHEQVDVITLDMEMPGMGGLEAIRRIMALKPTPIIVLSAHAHRGAELTLLALEAGAVDFVSKPNASLSGGLPSVGQELVQKVKSAARVTLGRPDDAPRPAPARTHRAGDKSRSTAPVGEVEIVAIGTSTGGPVALKIVLSQLPQDFPVGVVVVQHMPPVFTKAFAERLDATCAISVKEAEDGDPILPGQVLLAPGGLHMTVSRFGVSPRVCLDVREPVSGHRPSVDVLLRSVALEYGARGVGVIMTGMGKDGADGMHELRRRGGHVIAQDKDSSIIYGMNREVIVNGDAHEVAPVQSIAACLLARVGIPQTARRVS